MWTDDKYAMNIELISNGLCEIIVLAKTCKVAVEESEASRNADRVIVQAPLNRRCHVARK